MRNKIRWEWLLVAAVLLAAAGGAPPAFGTDLGFAGDRASVGVDLGPLADLALKEGLQIHGAARLRVADKFALKLPFTAALERSRAFFDVGLMLVYYPFGIGPFVSLSLVQFGFEGTRKILDENLATLDEVSLGWTWNFHPSWFVEASMALRDPSGTRKDVYEGIREGYPNYKPFRMRLLAGWNFSRRK